VYIKSFKKIELEEKITHITSGSEFSLAWNEKSLYTWGFGMNYVLLNGEEED
jgi:alpha-tubulin suppressor-like RCC1 family protein